MSIAQVNGITLDYEVHGEPAAPVVLLIMGLGMPAALWPDELVARLVVEGFRVVTFDNRDCGGSTRLKGVRAPAVLPAIWRALRRKPVRAPYTLDNMAGDTVRLLDALGIGQAHLVGASMGGMISQVIAARYPQRVMSLTSIMSSSGNPSRQTAFGSWRALGAIIRPPPPPDNIAAVVRHLERVFGAIGSPGFREYVAEMRPLFERVARRGLYRLGTQRQLLAILASGDRRELLREITAPTLVIHGADDPLVPLAAGRDTAATIRGSRLEVVDGMGHDFPPRLMAQIAGRIAAHCRESQPAVPVAAPAPAVPVALSSDAASGPATSASITVATELAIAPDASTAASTAAAATAASAAAAATAASAASVAAAPGTTADSAAAAAGEPAVAPPSVR
jgi:pimeloyl-ACP methyl ester carboxylesterase